MKLKRKSDEHYAKLPNCPNKETRHKMAISFIESPVYEGVELDKILVEQIRNGHITFQFPDLFQLTKEGFEYLEKKLNE